MDVHKHIKLLLLSFCYCLVQVYKEIEDRGEQAVSVRISYLEIYNESMFDLLSTLPDASQALPMMTISEDEFGVNVKGLSLHLAQNEEEALNLLFEVRWRFKNGWICEAGPSCIVTMIHLV